MNCFQNYPLENKPNVMGTNF